MYTSYMRTHVSTHTYTHLTTIPYMHTHVSARIHHKRVCVCACVRACVKVLLLRGQSAQSRVLTTPPAYLKVFTNAAAAVRTKIGSLAYLKVFTNTGR